MSAIGREADIAISDHLEIPTPRWTAYEAKRFKIDMPDEVPMTTRECLHFADLVHAEGVTLATACPLLALNGRFPYPPRMSALGG